MNLSSAQLQPQLQKAKINKPFKRTPTKNRQQLKLNRSQFIVSPSRSDQVILEKFKSINTLSSNNIDSFHGPDQVFNFETPNLVSRTSPNSSYLYESVEDFQVKLRKKDELIKYLERKCGEQLMISSRKFSMKIKQLEEENQVLREIIKQHQNKENVNFDEVQSSFIANMSGNKTPKFRQNPIIGEGFPDMEKIIQTSKERFSFDCTENWKTNESLEKIKNLPVIQRKKKFDISRKATCDSLKDRNCEIGSQTEKIQEGTCTQQEVLNNKQFGQQFEKLKRLNQQLSKQLFKIKSCNKDLSEQLQFFTEKINDCHEKLENSNLFSCDEIPSQFAIPDQGNSLEVELNYSEVLQIFGLESKGVSAHKQLIGQIWKLKLEVTNLKKQFYRVQKQNLRIISNKELLESRLEKQKEESKLLKHNALSMEKLISFCNYQIMCLMMEKSGFKRREACNEVIEVKNESQIGQLCCEQPE